MATAAVAAEPDARARLEIWQKDILCEGHLSWLSTSGGPVSH